MFAGADFGIEKARLMPGETLFCFTDGVPDARNPDNKLFTEKRLQALVSTPMPSAVALLDHVETTLFAHISTAAQFDDITMLILRRNE
jgi:sigma-B regulation protein RsbU (phosphoserine phosphatase)